MSEWTQLEFLQFCSADLTIITMMIIMVSFTARQCVWLTATEVLIGFDII